MRYFGVLVRYTSKFGREMRLMPSRVDVDLDIAERRAAMYRKNTAVYESATVVQVDLTDVEN